MFKAIVSLWQLILLENGELLGVREGLWKVFEELGVYPERFHRAPASSLPFHFFCGPEVSGFAYIPTIVFCLLKASWSMGEG